MLNCCGLSGEISHVWLPCQDGWEGMRESLQMGNFRLEWGIPALPLYPSISCALDTGITLTSGGWRCLPGSPHSQELMDESHCSSAAQHPPSSHVLGHFWDAAEGVPWFIPSCIPKGSAPRGHSSMSAAPRAALGQTQAPPCRIYGLVSGVVGSINQHLLIRLWGFSQGEH